MAGGTKRRSRPLIERFWAKVEKNNDQTACWNWKSSKAGGYGFISHMRAHRVSYEIHNGKIPNGMLVMHSCDNPACVNPSHLSVGTPKDNVHDMISKGRNAPPSQAWLNNIKRKKSSSPD